MTLKSLLELQSKSRDLEPEQERDISETAPRNGGRGMILANTNPVF